MPRAGAASFLEWQGSLALCSLRLGPAQARSDGKSVRLVRQPRPLRSLFEPDSAARCGRRRWSDFPEHLSMDGTGVPPGLLSRHRIGADYGHPAESFAGRMDWRAVRRIDCHLVDIAVAPARARCQSGFSGEGRQRTLRGSSALRPGRFGAVYRSHRTNRGQRPAGGNPERAGPWFPSDFLARLAWLAARLSGVRNRSRMLSGSFSALSKASMESNVGA